MTSNSRRTEQFPNQEKHTQKDKMTTEQGISRLTLGEIGNRVSAITIDSSKGGAIKREILQPALQRTHSTRHKGPPVSTNVFANIPELAEAATRLTVSDPVVQDTAPVKVEWVPGQNLLPTASRLTERDVAMFDTVAHSSAAMDISDDGGKCAFSNIEDIDAHDSDNPQLVSIYVNSIYSYMRQLEDKYKIHQNFLQGSELSGKMRAILIDWLCQVHSRFRLLQETMYLTVAIIDHYLQKKPCTKHRLQLVGVTSMLIASKYEEMYTPEVADFSYITDNAYTKQDVRDMEQDILRTLDFSFGRPHCLHFLRRNSKAGQVDGTKHTLAKYLMELAMVEYDMAHVKPSLVAAASLYVSMKVLDGSDWTKTLSHYSAYSESDLIPTARKLAKLVIKTEHSKLAAVRTKYSSSKFMKIATIPQLKSETLIHLAEDTKSS